MSLRSPSDAGRRVTARTGKCASAGAASKAVVADCPAGVRTTATVRKIRSVVTVDVLPRTLVRGVATTEIAVTDCSAATTAAYHSLLREDVVRRLIVRSDRSVGVVNVKRVAVKASAAAMIVSAPMGLAVSAVNVRPTPTRTRSAATTVSATRVSAASMAVAFETVVVATQVSAKTTTTVVMDNCVTIKAAARLATTTNPAPRGSAAKALGLGARSVWMADYRLF